MANKKSTKIVSERKARKRGKSKESIVVIDRSAFATDEPVDFAEGEDSAEDNDLKLDNGYTQWSVSDNGRYIPCHRTTRKVPSGIYEMKFSSDIGFYMQRQNHFSDDLMELPMKEVQDILEDIKTFWAREAKFREYGYTHKRGVLLHGPPGNGKSYLIQVLSRHLIKKMKGIVINLKDYDNVELFLNFAGPIIKTIEKDTPIIVIMEDIDSILEYNNSVLTKVLNMLDGLKQIDKVVYVATTNYPEKLQDRVANRPSRFDRKYKIGNPTPEVREYYIRHKLKPSDLKVVDVKKWVDVTDGLSIAHIKELIVSVIILGHPFEQTLETLQGMSDRTSSYADSEHKVGFNIKNSSIEDSKSPYRSSGHIEHLKYPYSKPDSKPDSDIEI